MFPVSDVDVRPIAPTLLPQARKIEERSPGLYVLAARQFRYPVQQWTITVRVDQYRKVNVLEKFILRATSEIVPAPSLEELAEILGLDPIFVEYALEELHDRNNVVYKNQSLYLTEEGRDVLRSEKVPKDPRFVTRYYFQDAVLDIETFLPHPLDEMDEKMAELENLDAYVQQDLISISEFDLDPIDDDIDLRELGLDVHDPEKGFVVTSLAPAGPPVLCWKQISIFVLYDTLSDDEEKRITFQARSEDLPVEQVGEWLEAQLQAQHLSLKNLCGITDEMIAQVEKDFQDDDYNTEQQAVEERLEEIRQQATTQIRQQREGQPSRLDTGTAIQLRDSEIRNAFLGALEKAREQIIIYSPWMNEQVVDDEFISLLEERVKRGVRILIGYGIGRNEAREDRPVSPALLERLQAVKTAEGTPGIIAEWLGNSHAKEVVIDRKVHFSGSLNWLSYRGDRFPRGETVYQVTIPTEVEKAYAHLAQRFLERAEYLWARTTDEARRQALCILGYLGYEPLALTWLQRNACYQFIPTWIALAHQAISAGQETRILSSLQALIKMGESPVDLPEPLVDEINQKFQSVLTRIKSEIEI